MTPNDELSRSKAMLQMVVDNIPAQIAYYDRATVNCVFANDAYAKANGKSAQWAVGKHCREIIGEPAWGVIGPHVQRVIDGESISYERMLSAPDGTQRRIEVNLLPHFTSPGEQVGVFVLIHDITRHYKAEQAVRDSEERLRKFASATTEAMIFHKDGVIEDCNEALGVLVGRSRESLLGLNLLDFLPPAQRHIAQEHIRDGLERTYQTAVFHDAGHEIPVESTSKRLHFNGQELRLVVARDISEQHELRERLAQALRQTESMLVKERELGELKTRFVSMASHEFRTPLSTIQTSVELLDHYGDRLTPEERRESMTAIQQSVDRMRSLMENFLTLGRMGVSFAGCNLQACDLPSVLNQAAAQVRSADGMRHGIEIQGADLAVTPGPRVMLDLDLLRQITGNLLTNACKYSAAQTLVTLRWSRVASAGGEMLQIDVMDQGMGIPESDVPLLFETFHRASNVGGIQGSGLGLAIVKRAVDAHGGSLDVKSKLGVGSCFTVRLPWQVAPT